MLGKVQGPNRSPAMPVGNDSTAWVTERVARKSELQCSPATAWLLLFTLNQNPHPKKNVTPKELHGGTLRNLHAGTQPAPHSMDVGTAI